MVAKAVGQHFFVATTASLPLAVLDEGTVPAVGAADDGIFYAFFLLVSELLLNFADEVENCCINITKDNYETLMIISKSPK